MQLIFAFKKIKMSRDKRCCLFFVFSNDPHIEDDDLDLSTAFIANCDLESFQHVFQNF